MRRRGRRARFGRARREAECAEAVAGARETCKSVSRVSTFGRGGSGERTAAVLLLLLLLLAHLKLVKTKGCSRSIARSSSSRGW